MDRGGFPENIATLKTCLLQLVLSGPVVQHGTAFQPSLYPYMHQSRPSPLSPHATLSPLPAHPALTPHCPLTSHATHSPLTHAFHPGNVAFQYRPIR